MTWQARKQEPRGGGLGSRWSYDHLVQATDFGQTLSPHLPPFTPPYREGVDKVLPKGSSNHVDYPVQEFVSWSWWAMGRGWELRPCSMERPGVGCAQASLGTPHLQHNLWEELESGDTELERLGVGTGRELKPPSQSQIPFH